MTPAKSRNRRSLLKQQGGFSLTETLVALGVFAVTASGMSNFLIHQVKATSGNHLALKAYTLAENALEAARAQRVTDLTGSSSTQMVGGVKFTVITTVQADQPSAGLKTVNALVMWMEPRGPQFVSVPAIYTEVRRN